MKLALVGVGDAGNRIVNRIVEVERLTDRDVSRGNVFVFDTDVANLDEPGPVPEDRRLLIGDAHEEVKGDGVDGDPDLAAEVARDDLDEIRRAFDDIGIYEVDGMLLVAGLGGGTGSGAGAVVLDELQAMEDEKPAYVLGVLPGENEGPRAALNAARSLRSFVPNADNVIAFDNDAWCSEEEIDERDYGRTNRELATRIVTLLGAGESDVPTVAENRIDPSDIMRTLDTGGISSIGYAATRIEGNESGGGFLSRLLNGQGKADDDTPDAAKVQQLVRRAVDSRLTLPCEVSSAERALIVFSGPPTALSRKGFETARYWLEQEADTVEVLAGDEPREQSSRLRVAVLFSNVTDVPRIDAMQSQAVAVQERTTGPSATRDDGDDDG